MKRFLDEGIQFIRPINYDNFFLDEIPEDVIEWRNQGGASLTPSLVRKSRVASAPPPRATGKKISVMELQIGDRVSHDTFGLGSVVAVAGEAEKAEAPDDGGRC